MGVTTSAVLSMYINQLNNWDKYKYLPPFMMASVMHMSSFFRYISSGFSFSLAIMNFVYISPQIDKFRFTIGVIVFDG